ncbi:MULTISPECIES: RusA family crossover junction endodeoxyribonuclease [Clostridium]|uniref:RusA family crossover junction endodeoxyribonuclease n=1 Tax=Clostridium TaxID=1485 RepID=UPI00069E8FEA|nr:MULTISPECIES: RusA family crossover junction endodeoxyribonuclease [Clostridium]KOF57568.1 Zn-finger containing protein [Clostridium sp. DMHC 10]MCD2347300.1 RusA family crossover junction endodeoxyribonuclease [Clostridium guangxiense]
MKNKYAKIVVDGSPISKSNFKLFNVNGRAILPYNSGKYHDRYALYEEQIAYAARSQNPDTLIDEAVIAILKVFYKSKKRHPDTNNITKSIFDGVEKSGIIVNDAQIRRIIIEEFYDNKNPRFELELFAESKFKISYSVLERKEEEEPILYGPPPNRKKASVSSLLKHKAEAKDDNSIVCQVCGKVVSKSNCISANSGKLIICKNCFSKLL